MLRSLSLKITNPIIYQPPPTTVRDQSNPHLHNPSISSTAWILASRPILRPPMPIMSGTPLSNMCKITSVALKNKRMDSIALLFVVLDPPKSRSKCHSINFWKRILSSVEEKRTNSSKICRKRLSFAHSSLNLWSYLILPFSMNSFMSFKIYGRETTYHTVKEKISKQHLLFLNSTVSLDLKENKKISKILKCMLKEIHLR